MPAMARKTGIDTVQCYRQASLILWLSSLVERLAFFVVGDLSTTTRVLLFIYYTSFVTSRLGLRKIFRPGNYR